MELNISCWLHVGYRKSMATIPACRDKPGWYVEHGKHNELSKNSRLGHVLLIGDDFIESLAHYPKVWSKYFGPLQSLNYGLRGDKTQNVLWRIENGSIPVNAETIVIHAGANNIIYDHSRDIANGIGCIALMCLKHKPKAKIILTGLLPFDINRKKKIRNINRYLKLLCSSGYISNCFYVKPDDDWLLPGGSLDVLLYRNGLSEIGMDKFAKAINGVITNNYNGVQVKLSDESDISSDEDTINFAMRFSNQNKTKFPPVKSKMDIDNMYRRMSDTRKRNESTSTNRSSTPSRHNSRSRSAKRNSLSDESKSKESYRNKRSSNSRSRSKSSSRPISPVFTGRGSRSRSTSRPISPVFTGKRCRSHCRSRSRSTSRVSERERWCDRALERLSDEVKVIDSFELKSTWSPSVSPSPRHSPTTNNAKESLKISIPISQPIKDEKRTVKKASKKETPTPTPTLPKQEEPDSKPPLSTLPPDPEADKTQHMYDKFLQELEKINKKECNYPVQPTNEKINKKECDYPSVQPTNGNLNGN